MKKIKFGEKVYQLQVANGWSNTKLAKKLKLHPSGVTRLLKTINPRITTIYKVAKAFGVDPHTLI